MKERVLLEKRHQLMTDQSFNNLGHESKVRDRSVVLRVRCIQLLSAAVWFDTV